MSKRLVINITYEQIMDYKNDQCICCAMKCSTKSNCGKRYSSYQGYFVLPKQHKLYDTLKIVDVIDICDKCLEKYGDNIGKYNKIKFKDTYFIVDVRFRQND
jgi:hypothetical protein